MEKTFLGTRDLLEDIVLQSNQQPRKDTTSWSVYRSPLGPFSVSPYNSPKLAEQEKEKEEKCRPSWSERKDREMSAKDARGDLTDFLPTS